MTASKQKGFTLIELLVVIAIIGMLTTIAVVALSSARGKARDAKRVADVKAIQNALELYYQEANGYPEEDPAIELGVDVTALCSSGFVATCGGTETEFMGLVPQASQPEDGDCDAAENAYMYEAPDDGSYSITFCLGDDFGDFDAGPLLATENGILNVAP